ncbi:hypothetical protein [Kordia jejudonensis]|uniref:hypothetical protein n=1 Tax=Kordia jejudonensis TaxID=1348245 RepID=UPI00062917C3|nr:hypothetical protein [Kordia jejudonensis]
MTKTTLLNRNLASFGIPIALLTLLVLFVQSSYFQANSPVLSLAITLDVLLTIPCIYFLLIRKTNIPKTTVVPMMILGLVIGMYSLPEHNQQYLQLFKTWFLPIIELSIATFIIFKVRKTIRIYKSQKDNSIDFFTTLKKTCAEILPKPLVLPFVTEISVFYYGFVYWKRRKLAENEFSYHKESGSVALYFVSIMLIGIEIMPIHHLLAKWSTIAAWILTILSIYSGFQVFGYVKSLMKRPIAVTKDTLLLRYGIMHEAEIPLSDIKEIRLSTKSFTKEDNILRFALLGELESHNVIIETHTEQTLYGLFGIKKPFTKLALHVDKPAEFREYLNSNIIQND